MKHFADGRVVGIEDLYILALEKIIEATGK
jgi:hypothetical protein